MIRLAGSQRAHGLVEHPVHVAKSLVEDEPDELVAAAEPQRRDLRTAHQKVLERVEILHLEVPEPGPAAAQHHRLRVQLVDDLRRGLRHVQDQAGFP
ncbi:MAG: hypothetical protein EXS64_07385 [Candidatus Latescibacteria bacterium]|nr:hypothetical protein [Candidatus Latescibacterota bacterium]